MEFNPQLCGHGVTATIGKGKPVILLRADMDALPITELSGEEFTCTSGNMHACGHDIHTAMLLTAARMLKEDEDHLHGTVKLSIEAGTNTGDKLRLRGKGVEDVHSYRKGDMYVVVKVVVPSKLTRDQKKLFEQLSKTDLETKEFDKIKKYL